jgi:large subunit ribosomal protein L17
MRHLKSGRKLGMKKAHRKAVLSNLITSLFDKERIITTVAKAKEGRRLAERLIGYAKEGGLHKIRLAARTIKNKDVLHKLFTDIAPTYKDKIGGYTRILKLGERKGDNAQTCIFELVDRNSEEKARLRKKRNKAVSEEATTSAQDKDEKEETKKDSEQQDKNKK